MEEKKSEKWRSKKPIFKFTTIEIMIPMMMRNVVILKFLDIKKRCSKFKKKENTFWKDVFCCLKLVIYLKEFNFWLNISSLIEPKVSSVLSPFLINVKGIAPPSHSLKLALKNSGVNFEPSIKTI